MPRIGREHASRIEKNETLEDRSEDLAGTTVSFMELHRDLDLGQFFKGLPDEMCQSHHWGVVEAGSVTFRYRDGSSEVMHAGDAFVVEPGHAPLFEAGTKMVMFSPADELQATNDAIAENMG